MSGIKTGCNKNPFFLQIWRKSQRHGLSPLLLACHPFSTCLFLRFHPPISKISFLNINFEIWRENYKFCWLVAHLDCVTLPWWESVDFDNISLLNVARAFLLDERILVPFIATVMVWSFEFLNVFFKWSPWILYSFEGSLHWIPESVAFFCAGYLSGEFFAAFSMEGFFKSFSFFLSVFISGMVILSYASGIVWIILALNLCGLTGFYIFHFKRSDKTRQMWRLESVQKARCRKTSLIII